MNQPVAQTQRAKEKKINFKTPPAEKRTIEFLPGSKR